MQQAGFPTVSRFSGMSTVVERLLRAPTTDATLCEMLTHLTRVATFVGIAVIIYLPYDGDAFNQPVGGWDENRTDESWGTYGWTWDWIDCMYFAMVTMATVGYGDQPTLPQGLRLFTIFFAVLGVIFVASSITVIADWISEQGRKRFIAKQRLLLLEAHRAAEFVRNRSKAGAQASESAKGASVNKHASPGEIHNNPEGMQSLPPSPPPSPPAGFTAAAPPAPPAPAPAPAPSALACAAAAATTAAMCDARGALSAASAGAGWPAPDEIRGVQQVERCAVAAVGCVALSSVPRADPTPAHMRPWVNWTAAYWGASADEAAADRGASADEARSDVDEAASNVDDLYPSRGRGSFGARPCSTPPPSPPPSPGLETARVAPDPDAVVSFHGRTSPPHPDPDAVVAYRGRTSPSLLDEDVMVTGPVKPSRTSRDSVGKDSDKSNGRTFDEAAGETKSKGLSGRLPSNKFACQLIKALRPTGVYFCLCIILGELENAHIEGCGHFGAGWACGSPSNCEAWKLSHELGGFCWSWVDQFYYGLITYLTIGYGDVSPHTKGGKALATWILIMGILCFTTLMAELNDIQQAKRLGAEKTLRQRLAELHEVIAQDNDGKVTAEEYILFNLKKMGKVEDETLALLRDQFKALDADGSGELDADDIEILSLAAAKIAQENLQT
jgi:hypothetical protein